MIVLTGGIGSGKSVVARILRLKGFGVFDCDYEARRLMHDDGRLKDEIMEVTGSDVYDGEGNLKRKTLGDRIFGDESLRGKVNRAVHESVRRRMKEWLAENDANIFVETAIAHESGIAAEGEAIWCVTASEKTRVKRVKARDERDGEEIERIIKIQANEERELERYGNVYRIDNDGDQPLLPVIEELLKTIK